MKNGLFHTPDGVRDIYGDECIKKFKIKERLLGVAKSYGYQPIETPVFEFFEMFSSELGTTPTRDLFKFFDREGNTVVLRPEITSSIARCAGKYFSAETMPLRLCYTGQTFINHQSLKGRKIETTQFGAELIGESSADNDAEMLSFMADCFVASGIKDFKISIGHVGILTELIDIAHLDAEDTEKIRLLVANRNYNGVREFAASKGFDNELTELFGILCGFYRTSDELKKVAEKAAGYPELRSIIEYLISLQNKLLLYGFEDHIFYEPGMISDYQYYTGIIFSCYSYGCGQHIARGGRYDRLMEHFGKERPAIGFAIIVDELLDAVTRQGVDYDLQTNLTLYIYDEEHTEEAITNARKTRANFGAAELLHYDPSKTAAEYDEYARSKHIGRVVYLIKEE